MSLHDISPTRRYDRVTQAERAEMNTMWWRLLIAGVAIIVVLCLGALEIVAERSHLREDSATPPKNADEPERSWERN